MATTVIFSAARVIAASRRALARVRHKKRMPMPSPYRIVLSSEEEAVLAARSVRGPYRDRLRATIVLAAAAGQGRTGSVIEIGTLRALALAAAGDQDAAVDALARTLALGCPQGYIRVFADEGPPMAALLARLSAAQRDQRAPARGITVGYLAALLGACGQADAVPPRSQAAAAPPGMVEPDRKSVV